LDFRKFLPEFLSCQITQLRKAGEEVDQPHQQTALHAWLDPSEEITSQPLGWLGGETFFSGENPYSDSVQLCEIDCSQLPATVWGGLGPRSGRLVFFLNLKDGIAAEAVLINGPEVAPPLPAHLPEDLSCYHFEQYKFPDFMPALPAWPIRTSCNEDTAEADGAYPGAPFADLSLADDRLKPQTLHQLKLLVEVAHRNLTDQHKAQMLQLENAQISIGENAELRSTLEKIIAEYERLIVHFSKSYSSETFSLESWVNAHDELKQLFRFDVDERLARAEPLIRIIGYQEVFRLIPMAARSKNEATKAACKHLRDITIDANKVLKEQFKNVPISINYVPNYGHYKKFKDDHPDQWESLAKRIRQIREEYTRLCFELFDHAAEGMARPGHDSTACGVYFHVGRGKPPESLEGAVQKLTELSETNRIALEKLDDVTEREATLSSIRISVGRLTNRLERTAKLRKQLATATAQDFARGTWDDVPAWVNGLIEDNVLNEHAFQPYIRLRNLMMQAMYREAPESIDADTKKLLYEQWKEEARRGLIQIGGTPTVWSDTFSERPPRTVMLIQVESNYLAGFKFGDVDSVVISIDQKRLAKNDFGQLWADVSH
jgi:hypothetical protein